MATREILGGLLNDVTRFWTKMSIYYENRKFIAMKTFSANYETTKHNAYY